MLDGRDGLGQVGGVGVVVGGRTHPEREGESADQVEPGPTGRSPFTPGCTRLLDFPKAALPRDEVTTIIIGRGV